MTGRRKPTAAAMPPAGYRRPEMVSGDGLSVAVVGEAGEDFGRFDFTKVAAPPELMRALVAGFARATGPGGRWKTYSSARKGAEVLRRFAREVSAANPQIATIGDVTAEVWWGWRTAIEATNRVPSQINVARALLRDVKGLPKTTRRAMNAKAPKPPRTYDSYSSAEFKRIRSAARRVVEAAWSRIGTNSEILARYRAGEDTSGLETLRTREGMWARAEWLDRLSRTGDPPGTRERSAEITEANRAAVCVGEDRPLREALFLTGGEVFALMALFVCEWGYNGEVLNSMTVSDTRADDRDLDDPVHLVDLDKPRRGDARYFSNAFSGKRARLWEVAVSVTQPARETLAALGHPTGKLFVAALIPNRTTHPTRLFRIDWSGQHGAHISHWSSAIQVTDDDKHPLPVTLSRLRLSEQAINEKSSQNSDAVSSKVYRYPDPQTHAKARNVVLQGQTDAVDHARVTVRMRTITPQDLAAARSDPDGLARELGVDPAKIALLTGGRLNTPAAACLDYHSSPFAAPGEPCAASFLSCLACPNAVATQDHLPRLVVLHDALVAISEVVAQPQWQQHYAEHLARLRDLLSQYASDAEIAQARSSATPSDIDIIEALLRGRLDR